MSVSYIDEWKKLDRHHKSREGINERLKKYRPKAIGEYEENGRKIIVFEPKQGCAPSMAEMRWE